MQTRKMKERTFSKTYYSQFNVATLFAAWISPEMTIPPVTKIEAEPKVGGDFILHSESENGVSVMKGKFLEFLENERLKYTWNWQDSDEETVILVEFKSEGGKTNIHLVHSGFATKESLDMHASGWDYYVEALLQKLEE